MINFETENEPKMKFFDFGAFQKIEKMLSHDKILFHMLFGAFRDTPCTQFEKIRKDDNNVKLKTFPGFVVEIVFYIDKIIKSIGIKITKTRESAASTMIRFSVEKNSVIQ